MSKSTIKPEVCEEHSVIMDGDLYFGIEYLALLDDAALVVTVESETEVSKSEKQVDYSLIYMKKNRTTKVSKPRTSFNLKRYLRGIGALDLLTLQKERREPLLHTAVKENRIDVVEVLIGRGTDPNIRGFNGTTPVHEAAARGHCNILQILLKCGADVTAQTSMGETPIVLAALAGHKDAVNLLLEAGAK